MNDTPADTDPASVGYVKKMTDVDVLKRLKYWNDDYKQNAGFVWGGNGVITTDNPAKTLVCTIPADSFYAISYFSKASGQYCTLFVDGKSVGSYAWDGEYAKYYGENTYPGLKYTDKDIQVHITCDGTFVQNGTPLSDVNPVFAYARECAVTWFNPKIMYKFEKIADQGRTVKQNLFNAALPVSSAGYGSDTVKYTVPKNSTVYFKTFCSRANKGPWANIEIFVNRFSIFKTDTATSYSDTSYFKVSALLDRDIEIAFNLSVYGDHRAFVIDVLN